MFFCRTASVFFDSDETVDAALKLSGKALVGRKLRMRVEKRGGTTAAATNRVDVVKSWQIKDTSNIEDISESGRLFVRNLAYDCSPDDLQTLFETCGPVAEVHLPVDSLTSKIKGFGFITYLLPEHAVLAMERLDGTTFKVNHFFDVHSSIMIVCFSTKSLPTYIICVLYCVFILSVCFIFYVWTDIGLGRTVI